jgi:hypothetical protein
MGTQLVLRATTVSWCLVIVCMPRAARNATGGQRPARVARPPQRGRSEGWARSRVPGRCPWAGMSDAFSVRRPPSARFSCVRRISERRSTIPRMTFDPRSLVPSTKGLEKAYMIQLPVTPANFPVHRSGTGTNAATQAASTCKEPSSRTPRIISSNAPGLLATRSVRRL